MLLLGHPDCLVMLFALSCCRAFCSFVLSMYSSCTIYTVMLSDRYLQYWAIWNVIQRHHAIWIATVICTVMPSALPYWMHCHIIFFAWCAHCLGFLTAVRPAPCLYYSIKMIFFAWCFFAMSLPQNVVYRIGSVYIHMHCTSVILLVKPCFEH